MTSKQLSLTVALLGLLPLSAQALPPRVGYVYPAGGQVGSSFEIELGGQYLADPHGVVLSGGDVVFEILEHDKLPAAQMVSDYRDRLNTIRSEIAAIPQGESTPEEEVVPQIRELLASVDLTEKQVRQIEDYTRRRSDPKRQLNNQIGETVRVRVSIAEDAEPGVRFLRLRGEGGLSNPVQFVVGNLKEVREPKAWRFHLTKYLGVETAPVRETDASIVHGSISLPATINGQILPGEVDEYLIEAEEGDQVVVSVAARSLIPYLADAVPGWFQSVVLLRDHRGRELAFSDDFRFNPDPVLFYKIPRSGKYHLQIHDSIYRGREDFVYRISVGELPFLTGIQPLGGQAGTEVDLVFQGGNLEEHERKRYRLRDEPGIVEMSAKGANGNSNAIRFHVDAVKEDAEREDNDRVGAAAELPIPGIVNGVIGEPKDFDWFRVKATGNRPVTFEIFARRLGSPLDSNLLVLDDDGKQIGWNDDFENPSAGLTTHHADARVSVKAPGNGICFVRVGDTLNQGSYAHSYRLKVTQGPPDLALRATPSSINATVGGNAAVTVHALRLDGYDGPIELSLKDAPKGFSLRNTQIPAGADSANISLNIPVYMTEAPVELSLEARVLEEGKEVATYEVVPAEDMTQAFITKHLVPVDALLIDIRNPPEPKS